MRPTAYCMGCKKLFKPVKDINRCIKCKLNEKKFRDTEFSLIVRHKSLTEWYDYLEKWYGAKGVA